ncbi:MAG: hypothetical protein ACI92Z_002862 [Paracoccaceae bacterium]|jgi:hypothetical protein
MFLPFPQTYLAYRLSDGYTKSSVAVQRCGLGFPRPAFRSPSPSAICRVVSYKASTDRQGYAQHDPERFRFDAASAESSRGHLGRQSPRGICACHRPVCGDTADDLIGRDLVQTFRQYGSIPNIASGDFYGPNLQRFLIDANMYLTPDAAFGAAHCPQGIA